MTGILGPDGTPFGTDEVINDDILYSPTLLKLLHVNNLNILGKKEI